MDLGCDLRSRHDVEERDPEAWRTLTLALGPKCDELEEPDILHSIRPRAPTYYILFDPGPRRSHPTSDPNPESHLPRTPTLALALALTLDLALPCSEPVPGHRLLHSAP